MRIVTAREQVEMLAVWRRTAGWADWNVTARYPRWGPEARTEEARLENGHSLTVSSGNWGGTSPQHVYWDYHIQDPHGETVAYRGMPGHPRIRTADEAKSLAEAHYEQLFPIGTDTGPHDSGVDYSDLNKFMGEL
jgi:hypothetical protein